VEYGDHYFDSYENVDWIQCIVCDLWFYGRCYNQSAVNTELYTSCDEGLSFQIAIQIKHGRTYFF
jgi:hypothetical protein